MNKLDIRAALTGIHSREEITFKKVFIISLCVLVSVAINFFGSILAEKIIFPLYLDSVMTFFITFTFGLFPGLLCALFSNLMLTIFINSNFLFVICHLLTVILSWLTFVHAQKNADYKGELPIHYFFWAALWAAIANGIMGNVIVDIVFGSVTGRPHADFLVQGIFSAVPNRTFATYFAGLIENLTDKMVSACISFGFYKLYIFFNKK